MSLILHQVAALPRPICRSFLTGQDRVPRTCTAGAAREAGRVKSDREFLSLVPLGLELGDPFCWTAAARPGLAGCGIAIFGSRPGARRRAPRISEVGLAALDFTSSRKLALAPAISEFFRSVAISISSSSSLAVRLSTGVFSLAADVGGVAAAKKRLPKSSYPRRGDRGRRLATTLARLGNRRGFTTPLTD